MKYCNSVWVGGPVFAMGVVMWVVRTKKLTEC